MIEPNLESEMTDAQPRFRCEMCGEWFDEPLPGGHMVPRQNVITGEPYPEQCGPVTLADAQPKWCSHCKIDSHDDTECWSTRMGEVSKEIVMPDAQPTPKKTNSLGDWVACAHQLRRELAAKNAELEAERAARKEAESDMNDALQEMEGAAHRVHDEWVRANSAEQRLAAVEADAKRWRYYRGHHISVDHHTFIQGHPETPERIDSVTDKAIAALAGKEECEHKWIANSGRGGEPDFRMNRQMSSEPLMHVMCETCGNRTWVTAEQWKKEGRHGND